MAAATTNTVLNVDEITKEALRVLHQKLKFVGSINRQYDDSFANEGAKIGSTLRIREPRQFTVRSGATLSLQNTTETNTSLTVNTQKGIDVQFSSTELTMTLDRFSEQVLNPAMSQLAAAIEADVLSGVYNEVYNLVGSAGTAPNALVTYLQAGQKLNEYLAPEDGKRSVLINDAARVASIDALKGLYQDSAAIAKQYREGYMGKTAGFDFMSSTIIPVHTNGTMGGTPLINDPGAAIASGDSTIPVDGWGASGTVTKGTVFTIAGVYAVHPETKVAYTHLQQFTVTANATASSGAIAALAISPPIITTGARQNCSALPADGAAITVVGSASTTYAQNLAFHKDAFTFATADLVMPRGVDFASRQVFDGISMRIVRDYDINYDTFPCRIDVLYGYKTIRPQLACRITG